MLERTAAALALAAAAAAAHAGVVTMPFTHDFDDATAGGMTVERYRQGGGTDDRNSFAYANDRLEYDRVTTPDNGGNARRGLIASVTDSAATSVTENGFVSSVDLFLGTGSNFSRATFDLQVGALNTRLGYKNDGSLDSANGGLRLSLQQNAVDGSTYSFNLRLFKPGAIITQELAFSNIPATVTSGKNNPLNQTSTLALTGIVNGSNLELTGTFTVPGTGGPTVTTLTAVESIASLPTLGAFHGFTTAQNFINNAYSAAFDNYNVAVPIPEPASLALAGVAGLLFAARRRR